MARTSCALLLGALLAGVPAPADEVVPRPKSTTSAFFCSLAFGFGAGHYYCRDHRAVYYTLADLGFRTLFAVGETGGGDAASTIGVVGTLGSWVWQSLDAPNAALRYNQRHCGPRPRRSVIVFNVDVGPSPIDASASSARTAALWTDPGAGRDLALGLSAARRPEPALTLRLDARGLGAGLSFGASF
jgi:hypothetical protein